MTRKEELLEYINTNIDGFHFLRVHEVVLQDSETGLLTTGQEGNRKFIMSTSNLIDTITNNYSDELVGNPKPEEVYTFKILSWERIERPIKYYE